MVYSDERRLKQEEENDINDTQIKDGNTFSFACSHFERDRSQSSTTTTTNTSILKAVPNYRTKLGADQHQGPGPSEFSPFVRSFVQNQPSSFFKWEKRKALHQGPDSPKSATYQQSNSRHGCVDLLSKSWPKCIDQPTKFARSLNGTNITNRN